MKPIAGTFKTEPVLNITLEGYEPLPEMRRKSIWHGMWELRSPRNEVLIVAPKIPEGFMRFFETAWHEDNDKATEFVVVSASVGLLRPLSKQSTTSEPATPKEPPCKTN